MKNKYYFASLERMQVMVIDDPVRAHDYRHRDGWFEITREEFQFIQTHSPKDAEWVAKYGS